MSGLPDGLTPEEADRLRECRRLVWTRGWGGGLAALAGTGAVLFIASRFVPVSFKVYGSLPIGT